MEEYVEEDSCIIIDIKLEEEKKKLKLKLEEEKKKLEEEIRQLNEEIIQLNEEIIKYKKIENYKEEEKGVIQSYIFNKHEINKILNDGKDVDIDVEKELFNILETRDLLKSENEIYDDNIKIIYDKYQSLIKIKFDIVKKQKSLREKYANKNNLEKLLNNKTQINNELINKYYNILITKNKYENEYENNKKEIEDSKTKLRDNLREKLKTEYFVREDLDYINLFKINDKTPIDLGTYEVPGELVDKKILK